MTPRLWVGANGARCWDGEDGEGTGLKTRGVRSSFEGTGSLRRLGDSQMERSVAYARDT